MMNPPANSVPPKPEGLQKPGLSLALRIVAAVLLIVYPGYMIWWLIPFYPDPWSVVDILVIALAVIAGFQILNRHPLALRNTKIFIILKVLVVIAVYIEFYVLEGNWELYDEPINSIVGLALIWLLVVLPKSNRQMFSDVPVPHPGRWVNVKKIFRGNYIGQVFAYSIVVLLAIAFYTRPLSTPTSGSSKQDAAQEEAANTWLEDHDDNLKQLIKSPTGMKPKLAPRSAETSTLDAQMIYERKSPAVVVIYTDLGYGSGFLLSSDGIVATSMHILQGAHDAVVMDKSGQLYAIRSILSCDKDIDYCLFSIDIKDAPFVMLADFSTVKIGDPIVVIGHPYGYSYSLSHGLVSEIHEYDKAGTYFQFTAPISTGSSGGPVLNQNGHVIGISNSLVTSDDAQGLNLATAITGLQQAITR